MKLNPQDLEKIASLTLDHYNKRAEDFWQGTRDHNVKQNVAAFLQWIEGKPPFMILDFGCGPGRDLRVFAEFGHIAVGLEGAAHFVSATGFAELDHYYRPAGLPYEKQPWLASVWRRSVGDRS